MHKNSGKLFDDLALPEGAIEKVMVRLREEQRILAIKKRSAIFSFGVILPVIFIFPILNVVKVGVVESGFLYFLSLLFSDFGIVVLHWRNFVMSLLETLPIMSLTVFFVVIFIFLESLKFLARDFRNIFPRTKLIIN